MDDRRAIRRGYDTLATTFAERGEAGDRETRVFEEFFGSGPPSPRVLDAGCGHGTPALRRATDGAEVVGLDLSRELLRIAAAVPSVAPVQGDLTALPFADGSFDAVVAHRSLIHVPRSERAAVAAEFARVLRSDGRVLVSEAPGPFERTTDDWLGRGVEMTWTMVGADATGERLRDAGFEITDRWDAPDPTSGDDPKPVFVAGRLRV